MAKAVSQTALLSLHDIMHFYESDLPLVMDLDKFVKMPNLIDLLYDYLCMAQSHRSIIGKILIWDFPQYKRPVNAKTGRMMPLEGDSLYKMKILEVYKQMR